jgi:predicted peptidase
MLRLFALFVGLLQAPAVIPQNGLPTLRGIHELTFQARDVGEVLYGISIPNRFDPKVPRPLIVALHPGGARMRYYGAAFTRQVVAPALNSLDPIIVAPDCPARGWTDAPAERAVLELIEYMMRNYAIDRRRILVIGFSMGGRGTWFMASRHADLFTAAIPMAASTGDEPLERLGRIPTYVIHGTDDEVVPYEPAEQNARALAKMGRPVRLETVYDVTHFQMGGYIEALRKAGRWVAEQWKK